MNLEQQLSTVRQFQTEVSMLRTRLLDTCEALEPERATFCRIATQLLQDALDALVRESRYIETLQGRVASHERYCDTLDEYGQPL